MKHHDESLLIITARGVPLEVRLDNAEAYPRVAAALMGEFEKNGIRRRSRR